MINIHTSLPGSLCTVTRIMDIPIDNLISK